MNITQKTSNKMVKKRWQSSLLVVTIPLLFTGCSSVSSTLNATGEVLGNLGDGLQSITRDVQVVQISKKMYDLTEYYNEPVTGFDSWAMRVKASQVCQEGYIYRSRNALKKGAFSADHAQCIENATCGYALEWRIECKKVPYEPFSLFGKT